jgi:hypothetical protein
VAAAVAIPVGAWVVRWAAGPQAGWLLRALTSRLFVFCAVLLVVCAALAWLVLRVLWELGRPHRAQRRSEEGVAIIEFALAFPFLLALALLMAQTSLVMVGNVCVHYSAFCAARAAAVQVPKDFGAAEPRNRLLDSDDATGKMRRIKPAAAWAVMPVSYGGEDVDPYDDVMHEGLARFFSVDNQEPPVWIDERLGRRFSYAMDHTQVTVRPPQVDENDNDDLYNENEDLHVTVQHTFYLAIPYAARIFAFFPGGVKLDFGDGEFGSVITASCSLPNEGVQDYVDIETFP